MTDMIPVFVGVTLMQMVRVEHPQFFLCSELSLSGWLRQCWDTNTLLGRADFLCMGSDGTITGYLNQGIGVMIYQGQIKHTEGKERKDLRLTDVSTPPPANPPFENTIKNSIGATRSLLI